MDTNGGANPVRAEIRFWLGQAFICLIAAIIASQSFRYGNIWTMPTRSDLLPILLAFVMIFAAVACVTLLARRLNANSH